MSQKLVIKRIFLKTRLLVLVWQKRRRGKEALSRWNWGEHSASWTISRSRIERLGRRQNEACPRLGDRDDDRHVRQADKRLPQEVHSAQIPRGWPPKGRVCLHRSLRRKIPRDPRKSRQKTDWNLYARPRFPAADGRWGFLSSKKTTFWDPKNDLYLHMIFRGKSHSLYSFYCFLKIQKFVFKRISCYFKSF